MGTADETGPSPDEGTGDLEWRQGSLFYASSLPCLRYDITKSGEAQTKARRFKEGEKYIAVSHDCDIERGVDLEPFIEAILCTTESSKFVERLEENRNSARWFAVDPSAGLVANANYRVTIARKLLPSLPPPEPWPSSPERFAWFRWWLGYRFDRPSLEGYEEEHLKEPIEEVLHQLDQETPEILTAFFQAVQELRVSGPSRTEEPWDFQLVMLTGSRSLTSNQAEGIEVVRESIRSRFGSEPILLNEDVIVASLQEFSVADYRQTWLLPLDHYAEAGGDADAPQ